jgi:hypothetical protein
MVGALPYRIARYPSPVEQSEIIGGRPGPYRTFRYKWSAAVRIRKLPRARIVADTRLKLEEDT